MSIINLGLIGCGQLGRIHAACVAKISDAQFTVYADLSPEAANSMLTEFGGCYATADVQKVLKDDEIDAVYVCTHHDSHARLAKAAAEAGKHIFIEKPLALKLDDCEAVAKAVEKAGVFLMPAYKMRYYPLVRMAREFIPNPQVIVGQIMDNTWPDQIWPQDPVEGGGNVHSQGCHMTDIIRWLSGSEPVRLWATGGSITHPGHPCIDQCVASIEFANGHVASWIQGDVAVPPFVSKFFIELFGSGRSVQLHDRLKKATFSDGKDVWTEQRDEEEGFQLENEEFITALKEGREPDISAEDGLQATRIVLAAERAIQTRQVQQL